ncbi:MAG: HAMP domain-containing methyl-accepting chemotaxis protein [Planctomycetota bacterium]|nr:HAMP domain-containing methyl-accepting chemotaxis protein [Planctomycetota bacterium]
MKIGTQILILGLGGALAAGAIGVAATVGKERTIGALSSARVIDQARVNFLTSDMMHDAIRADVLESFLAATPEERRAAHESFQEHRKEFIAQVDANLALPLPAEVKASLSEVTPALNAYVEKAQQILTIEPDKAEALYPEFNRAFAELADRNERVSESLEKASNDVAATASTASAAFGWIVTAVPAAAALLLIAGAVFTRRSVTSGVAGFASVLERVSQNDFTVRFDESGGGEVGALAASGNRMVTNLRAAFGKVDKSSQQVAAAATELAATAAQIASGIRTQSTQVEQVSAAIEEVSSSNSEVAHKGAEAAQQATESGKQAAEGGQLVDTTVKQIGAVADEVQQTAQAIADLGRRGEQIGQIISVINDIADQTNLLALNAAIEAARAGEHGRGFAVVADEVRKLAERTTKATEEVGQAIKDIQAGTSDAVQRMDRGRARVDESVKLAQNSGAAMNKIVAAQRTVQDLVQAIAGSAAEQRTASEQIAKSVSSIAAVARETTQGAEQTSQAANELSQEAESLRALVNQFRI